MPIIQEEKQNLVRGKHVLSSKGYSCEAGRDFLFVYLQSDSIKDKSEIESELSALAGCPVWVIGVS